MSWAEKYEAEEREPLCVPTERCSRATPWGIVEGMKCAIGDEIYHNTTLKALEGVVEEKAIKPGVKKGILGQDVLSMSSCPPQHYGGNIKLVVPSEQVDARAACYVNFGSDAPEEHQAVERGMEEESRKKMNDDVKGDLRVRGDYAIQPDIYTEECQYDIKEKVSADKIKRIEYWIPWRINPWGNYSTRCRGSHPGYANVDGKTITVLHEQIAKTKESAKQLKADFKVKSCFSALKTGWGDQYIPLNEANLAKIARGETPEVVRGKIPQKCRC